MIRVTIDSDGSRLGSLFVSGGLLNIQAPDTSALLGALAEVFAAVHGRDAAKTFSGKEQVHAEAK